MDNTVSEKDLVVCMTFIKDMRAWAVANNTNPWTVRQALIISLAIDTAAARARGIPPKNLQRFDERVKADTKKWLKRR